MTNYARDGYEQLLGVKKIRAAAKKHCTMHCFFGCAKLISLVDSNEVKTTQANQT
jgi:hypothetical protein